MPRIFIIFIFIWVSSWMNTLCAQNALLPYQGIWSGSLAIYHADSIQHYVPVTLTIQPQNEQVWQWETVYQEPNTPPVVKPYLMRSSTNSNVFFMDENNGIMLVFTAIDSKLISQFETENLYFTSQYTLQDSTLYFEVFTFGKSTPAGGVGNFELISYQKATLHKLKK